MNNKLERNHEHINITDNTFIQIENEKEERFKIHKKLRKSKLSEEKWQILKMDEEDLVTDNRISWTGKLTHGSKANNKITFHEKFVKQRN